MKFCHVGDREKYPPGCQALLSLEERYLFPLQVAWGLTSLRLMWNQIISSCKPSTANKPIAVILLIQAAFLKANLRKSSIQQLFKELISESFPRSFFVSSQHLPGRYHVTTTQQPAPIAQ